LGLLGLDEDDGRELGREELEGRDTLDGLEELLGRE